MSWLGALGARVAKIGLVLSMLTATLIVVVAQSGRAETPDAHPSPARGLSCAMGEGLRDPLLDRVPANNWGQTKTITALITGVAADQGLVDIDAPIGTYLPTDLGDTAHRAVTLRNLLQASSGVQVNQVRGLNFFADQSRAREFFTMPIVHEPGTYFEYDQIATSGIIYVVRHAIWQREPGLDFQD